MTTTARTNQFSVELQGDLGSFCPAFTYSNPEPGLEFLTLTLTSDVPAAPDQLALTWSIPADTIQARWDTSIGWNRSNNVDYGGGLQASATANAPVMALYNLLDENRLTFALSDALNPTEVRAGIREENATFVCGVRLFVGPGPLRTVYTATLRLDSRPVSVAAALRETSEWWAAMPEYTPAPVPEVARQPMYSTWYSFHQNVTPEAVEQQCAQARELGCLAVIMDDGWQTADSRRGYAYCGDWEVAPERISDMAAHVQRIHDLGMKYLLWYSVPFVGAHSKAWTRFQDQLLDIVDIGGTVGVLDPRFPDVREYLIDTYERAMRDWNLDGFKLDFVDSFRLPAHKQGEVGNGRDMESVPAAVDRLLSDTIDRLRAINPDVMVEFRQHYIGPCMRKYGNMFRAGDCPDDALTNRVRTLDIRMLAGDTATHADMMMWHGSEPVESAALQIIHTLFSVPQISVLLDSLPADHLAMVTYWLRFWKEHRATLLDGLLEPMHVHAGYQAVRASTASESITAVYGDVVVPMPGNLTGAIWIVNGALLDRVVVEWEQPTAGRIMRVRNCMGEVVQEVPYAHDGGVCSLSVPRSGTIELALA